MATAQTIKLTDEQVDEISIVDQNLPYRTGKRALEGKTYNQYKFEGTVFTVDSNHPFCQAFAEGKIDSVKLIKGTREVEIKDADGNVTETQVVDSLQFDSFVSFAQTLNRAEHKAKVSRFKKIEEMPVTDSLLSELGLSA